MENKKKSNTGNSLLLSEYGKLPPQDIKLEEAVLGALMIAAEAYAYVSEILRPETFYKEAHQKIYQAIVDLASARKPIDMLTVPDQLKHNGTLDEVGGSYYITQLTNKVASAAHIEYHARILAQKYLARELIWISHEMQNQSYDELNDIDDVIFSASSAIEKLQEKTIGKSETNALPDVMQKSITGMYERKEKYEHGIQNGINTGLFDLNRITAGWQKGDLIILAARPAMGKTAIALKFAKSAAKQGNSVVIFELEMTDVKLSDRLLLSESEVCPNNYKVGRLTLEETKSIERAAEILREYPILIDSNSNVTMEYIRNKSRLLHKQRKCEIVIIDYLQLIEDTGNKNSVREQEVAKMSRKAKLLAKELDIPVILLAQLSRKTEERSIKKPMLSDLRESGAIEQDADMVIFIYRDEYYNSKAEKGKGNLIIAKYRNGEVGEIDFCYNESMTKIFDYTPQIDYNVPVGKNFSEPTRNESLPF